ncbi:MAG: YHS domain-containing protein [Hoeflea sp.]|uniref:YHS domain-containing protein n=1 Tax=Hoeflea sp. TaxID=1940281 RepID=UPI001D224071|nr:YHS domain-containing protein [Hoeflea sp.]MBU4529314.1 YHS domain-containing protein [Alphaproteobacteria bacterium]MBU4545481.1 YHS domain-containing protein [Alphaproteobacteria bacterium]MBU4550196.1 YHS domain-containing protein [Alphaproteobacteria bacterium]MBV1723237.1 YHS domain-containing protein [Hoeflea sp.]MBV1782910.1 YHS domain-containing protein [Hoeflea sp.]
METILYFLFWAGLIFIMMRFGCGAHVMGHGNPATTRDRPSGSKTDVRWTAPETDTDPVCGISVQTRNAKSAVHDGHVYYFCSRECRERFEAAPDSYLAKADGAMTDMREQAHG